MKLKNKIYQAFTRLQNLLTCLFLLILTTGVKAETQSLTIESDYLKDVREVRVSLPPNYKSEEFYRFPVLYITDASSQIDHISSMVHYLSGTISPMIVVGVVQKKRFAELAPFNQDQTVNEVSDNLRKFIIKELKPFISNTYRTADFSVLSGHSLGGVFTLNAYFKGPSDFDAFIPLAPTMAWGNEKLFELLPERLSQPEQPYLSISFEGKSTFPRPKNSFNTLNDLISEKAHLSKTHVVEILSDEDHMSVAHLGTYRALKRLFNNWFLSLPEIAKSEDAYARHYNGLSKRLGYQVKPTEYELWSLTSALLNQKNIEVAERLANHARGIYPDSHFSYSLLADVALAKQEKQLAKDYLVKAVELSHHLLERKSKYQDRLKELQQ